jgi:hypothetical protein
MKMTFFYIQVVDKIAIYYYYLRKKKFIQQWGAFELKRWQKNYCSLINKMNFYKASPEQGTNRSSILDQRLISKALIRKQALFCSQRNHIFFSFLLERKKKRIGQVGMSVAVCCMTMRMDANLDVWIHHHLHIVGIDYIFLRVVGDNIFNQQRLGPKVFVLENEIVEDAHIDSVRRQQERQKRFVDQCLRVHAPRLRVRYLLHIDDDELLVLHKRWSGLKPLLQEKLQQQNQQAVVNSFRIQNYEAVLLHPPPQKSSAISTDGDLFFLTTHFKDGALEE